MALVLSGDGTVTGLAVGGLPDGTVDAGTLATDSVTAAKIAADSVDSAELIDGAVDDSHIAALASSKLTGALPAISGASLTGITTGKVLQIVEHTVTAGSRNSDTYGDLYSVNITPSATSSKILVMAVVGGLYMNLASATNQTSWRLARTTTGSSEVAPTGHNTNYQTEVGRNDTTAGSRAYINMTVLDEPTTTTETKYAVQCKRISGSGGISICDTSGTSVIVLMEISG